MTTSVALVERLEQLVQREGESIPKMFIFREGRGPWYLVIPDLWFVMAGGSRREALSKSISCLEGEQEALLQEGWDMKTLEKKIFDAYPYGSRKYHPYKQWLKVQKEALKYAERMGVKP